MKSLFYHASPFENLFSIAQDGLKPSADGYVHLCRFREDASAFGVEKCWDSDSQHFIVYTILLDLDSVEFFQAQPLLSVVPIDCFRFKGSIPPECIATYLTDLHFYQ